MPFGFSSTSVQQALVDYAEELEDKLEGSGIKYLQDLRGICLAQIEGGSSSEFVSTTVNGQTFSAQIQIGAADLLTQVSAALKELRGEKTRMTYPTFQGIPH